MTLRKTATKPRQRWALLIAAVAALTLVIAAVSLAVHDTGAFELDVPSANAQNDAVAGDDWDNICVDNPTTCTLKASYPATGGSAADSSSHVNDGDLNATIFTGGGSKDGQDISSWLWKDGAGGLPDKDNLLHSYAAKYSLTADPVTCPSSTATCELIYFGSDRYANDGDATQAFWFLQNPVTLNGASDKGGTHFTGVHRNGDLLIISEFSNGGTKSTITVYTWQNGALQLEGGGDDQSCTLVQLPDPFCGIVNTNLAPTTAPWPFLDKAGSTNFRQGELYEAGINLSDPTIALADECFSSFVAETRSSTSVTATLKDFVLGPLESCVPALTTTASNTGTVASGVPVTDTARVTVTGASNPADPTGTVTFFLCKDLTGCPSGGTNVGTGTLENQPSGTTTDGIAEATSPTVNDGAKTGTNGPLAPGRYCFRAEWPGSTTYPGALSHTNNTTECFTVQGTTGITTDQSWLPQDSATITATGGPVPTGTVVFSLYNNGTCSGTAAATFTDTAAPYATDNLTYRTASTIISWSATFTPTAGSGFAGSTTTRCERSDLTINNSASAFPPPPTP